MVVSARKQTSRPRIYGAKGAEASQLRRRKHALIRRFGIPEDVLGGSLSLVYRKCGKASCRCATGERHPMWTLTYSVDGRRRVEFIPEDQLDLVRPLADAGRAYRDAVREVSTLNAQLLSLWREQQRARKRGC